MNLYLLYALSVFLIPLVDAQDFVQKLESEAQNTYKRWPYEDDDNDPHRRQYSKDRTQKEYQSPTRGRFTPIIEDVFEDISNNFKQIQKKCKSRKSCLKEEKHLLINKSRAVGRQHPVYQHLQNILNLMARYSKTDKFISQLYLFKQMSQKGQQDYRSGLRIQSLRHKHDPYREPPHYLVDDILNLAIQQIEKNRRQCQNRSQCLELDRKTLQELARQVSARDPSYKILMTSAKELVNQADQQFYNGLSLIAMYRQKGYEAASKVRFASKEAQEWRDINKSKTVILRQARIIDYSEMHPRYGHPAQIQRDYLPQRHPPSYPLEQQKPTDYYHSPQHPPYMDERYSQPFPYYQDQPHQVPKSEESEGFFSIITNLFRL
ncbi:MAG TPA: hypothetical protein VNJ29_01115 [Candidatus Nitrosotenuis sp.]|jgi:hypothetical protein|nr:hypothetical protein [Candidatus Nitrosotenuis sp.]